MNVHRGVYQRGKAGRVRAGSLSTNIHICTKSSKPSRFIARVSRRCKNDQELKLPTNVFAAQMVRLIKYRYKVQET